MLGNKYYDILLGVSTVGGVFKKVLTEIQYGMTHTLFQLKTHILMLPAFL